MATWTFAPNAKPLNIVKTEGSYLYLDNGDRILDAAGGAIVSNIGHGRKEVIDAIHRTNLDADYIIPPWLSPSRQKLVDRLCDSWLDPSLNHVHFTCGGSEGIECAVKIAFMYHASKGNLKRTKVLKREISYHGTTVTATAVGGHELRKKGIEHVLDPHPKVKTPHVLRCPSSDPLE